ncbi:MAG: hypothetical protein DCC75_04250 [Proteobacteria bacterium]|nr:MAG: hypothetical protein DCC75_04250 [Pseudomonadota bacterium]
MSKLSSIALSSADKQRAVLLAVITTGVSLIPTAYATLISNSVVLIGAFLRCFVEFGAIFISWIIMRQMSRADRSRFQYGLGKLEQAASIVVGFAMLLTCLILTALAIMRLYSPVPLQNPLPGLILAALSVAGNSFLAAYTRFASKKESSAVLEAQIRLFQAKAFACLIVCVSLGLEIVFPDSAWASYSDPAGSLILVIFLASCAMRILSASISDLLDRSIEEALQLKVLKVIVQHDLLYSGFHGLRTRRSGKRFFIEVFLSFAGDPPLSSVLDRIEKMKGGILEVLSDAEVSIVPTHRDG